MANVIKHKRGSGSDPVASDLVVGEVAIRTDVGKLFTKMDNGSVAEIAGGGSDIAINTLSSSSATGGGSATFNGSAYRFTLSAPPSVSAQQLLVSINGVIQKPVAGTGQPSEGFSVSGNDIILGDAPATGSDFFILTFKSLGVSEPADNSVTSAKIVDGAIVNADINASAAIAGSKITPTFTSDLTISSGTPTLNFTESDANPDYRILTAGGDFVIQNDQSGSFATRFKVNPDGHVDVTGNLDVGAGLDVTGAITGTAGLSIEGATVFNDAGADVDFRVEGDTEPNLLFVDASADRVAIGTSSPAALFESRGSTGIMARFRDSGNGIIDLRTTGTNNSDPVQIDANNRDLTFAINSSEKMRINSSGLVNIGSGANASGLSPLLHLHKATSNATAYFHITNADTGISNTNGLLIGYNSSLDALIFNKQSTPIRFATAGSERMRITGDGPHLLLGGTTDVNEITESSANAGMVIGGTGFGNAGVAIITSTSGTGRLYFGDAVANAAGRNRGQINYGHSDDHMRFATAGSECIRLDSSGRLLAGSTTTSNNGRIQGFIAHGSTAGESGITSVDTTSMAAGVGGEISFMGKTSSSGYNYLGHVRGIKENGTDTNTACALTFHTRPTLTAPQERMRIDSAGAVRIAHTSFTADTGADDLIVGSGNSGANRGITILNHTGQDGRLCFGQSGDPDAGMIKYSHGSDVMQFFVESDEKVRIGSNGDIDIDEAIGQTHSARVAIQHSGINPAAALLLSAHSSFQGSTLVSAASRNTTNGSYIHFKCSINGIADKFRVLDNGNCANTNNSFSALSDETLKENIVDAGSQWNDIKNIKVRKFNFKEGVDPEKPTLLGVIAQEAELVSPGLVESSVQMQDGVEQEYKTFKYSILYMKAIKALQEAQTRIETLETKVTALEAK